MTSDPGAPIAGMVRPRIDTPVRTIGRRTFDFSRRIAVMAIVNRTPDSFFDEGRTFALDLAVAAAVAAAEAGADFVDIGGVPFAPGPELPAEEEADRVVPVVAALAARSDVVISVDTFQPLVAEAAIAAGACVINDTSGLRVPRIAEIVASSDATLVITHSLAEPRTPYPSPVYADVAGEVAAFLRERVATAVRLGVPEDRIIVDPGHDLNKSTVQSLELTRRLDAVTRLGLPTLAAISNKDFIGESLDRAKRDRLAGSLAVATICAMGGARILRMHDVAAAVDAARMLEAVAGWRAPVLAVHNAQEA